MPQPRPARAADTRPCICYSGQPAAVILGDASAGRDRLRRAERQRDVDMDANAAHRFAVAPAMGCHHPAGRPRPYARAVRA